MKQLVQFLILFIISIVQCNSETIRSKEIFGFTNFVSESIYKKYDLKKISVLVFLDDNIDKKFIEYAQSNNVKTYLTGKLF